MKATQEVTTSAGATPQSTALEATWEQLVTAALLGAERRTPPGGSVASLLDLAAVHTVRQRAGLLPGTSGVRPAPAPVDERRPLPPAAVSRLGLLLAAAARRSDDNDRGRGLGHLLGEWLEIANACGYRAPAAQLPALLSLVKVRSDIRGAALTFGGPRALWLAELNPEWHFALRALPSPPAAGGQPALLADEDEVRARWEEGLLRERVPLLRAVRRHDPAAARGLLSSTWRTERAEDRRRLLDVLEERLSEADEPFLEAALRDRSKNVRAAAAELLTALPGSDLARRMFARASDCVTFDPGAGPEAEGSRGECLVVDPPYEWDAEVCRDFTVPDPPPKQSGRTWWLKQTVQAAPLTEWSAHLGGRSPQELIALPVTDGWREALHTAWCTAAVKQQDVEWAQALLSAAEPASKVPGHVAKLLTVLPEAERTEWAARRVAAHGLSDSFQVLSACPAPWPPQLSQAVVDALKGVEESRNPWQLSGVLGLIERRLDPSLADRLAPLATRRVEGDRQAHRAGYWADTFIRLVQTLHTRTVMRRELEAGVTAAA